MAKKEFQAESKKLMDMMINSIYTNKEIFLRELISNASDAIDKLYYKSLTDTSVGMNKGDFRILLTRDKDSRTLTISDNGIGMTREELEQNLGTITLSFKSGTNLDLASVETQNRIKRAEPVCAHDHGRWKQAVRQSVDTTDEGVHAGAIFVMHLR